MIYGMHYHISNKIVVERDKLDPGERIVLIKEGYRIFGFDNWVKVTNPEKEFIGYTQIQGTLQTKISYIYSLYNLPIINLFQEAGYRPRPNQLIRDLEDAAVWVKNKLFTENREKTNIDWLTIIIASMLNFETMAEGVADVDFHVHDLNPIIVHIDIFDELKEGDTCVAIEEGCRVFDLNNPTEVIDISGRTRGWAQVLATIQTKISNLNKLNLPTDRLIEEAGEVSVTQLRRSLKNHFFKKSDPDWVAIIIYKKLLSYKKWS